MRDFEKWRSSAMNVRGEFCQGNKKWRSNSAYCTRGTGNTEQQ